MNISQKIGLVLTSLLFALALPAYAHAPTVVIESIDGYPVIPGEIIPIVVPSLPWTVIIEGYVEHSGNWNQVDIRATDNDAVMYGPQNLTENSGFTEAGTYEVPWLIESAGVHVVRVIAAHGKHESSAVLGGGPASSNKGCSAAPSIANHYLKQIEIKNKDIVSEVAKQTGKKGSLWAKDSCAQNYAERTITFVVDLVE